jgi:hypothetical protein
MQIAHIWHKLDIHRTKVILLFILALAAGPATVFGQRAAYNTRSSTNWVKRNNPNYDNRKLSYGFLIALHNTAYNLKYSEKFVTPDMDTVLSVQPQWSPGFVLGLIVNYRLGDFFDLRLTPQVAFYEHKLNYMYRVQNEVRTDQQVVETTFVEFPLLLKYKSERRGNVRMYMVGGIKPGFEASGKKNLDNTLASVEVKGFSTNLDIGFGFDLYYPLFKFSPELRFSRGITNMLANTTNKYGQQIKNITTNTITVYFLFQ